MNEKLSMLYIPEALRHYSEWQDFSLGEPERIDNIFLYQPMNEKLSMLYIPEALRHYSEWQDFSLGEPERIDNIFLYQPQMKN